MAKYKSGISAIATPFMCPRNMRLIRGSLLPTSSEEDIDPRKDHF